MVLDVLSVILGSAPLDSFCFLCPVLLSFCFTPHRVPSVWAPGWSQTELLVARPQSEYQPGLVAALR